MSERKRVLIAVGCLLLAAGILVAGAVAEEEKPQYVGVAKCKGCHSPAAAGEVYKIWESKKHAGAFETLKGEESKKIAEKMGLGDPSTAAECLRCHVTAYGKDAEWASGVTADNLQGVQCEACHGPGSLYKSPKIMSRAKYKADWAAQNAIAVENGLVMPDDTLCKNCHNEESPTYQPLENFDEALKAIAHPVPYHEKAE